MSLRWSDDELLAYQERQNRFRGQKPDSPAMDSGPEKKLQQRIENHCEKEGFYFFHDRSRGANRPGHPDLVVALPAGRTLWLELKARGGRLSSEQKQVGLLLMGCGHEWYEVRSFKGFLEILYGDRDGKGEAN